MLGAAPQGRVRIFKQKKQLRRVVMVVTAVAVLGAAPAAWWDSSSAAVRRAIKPPLKITAQIRIVTGDGGGLTWLKLSFTPSVIKVGPAIIVVRNSDPRVAHQVSINGVYTSLINPRGTSVIKTTFKRSGSYAAATGGGIAPLGGETGGDAILKVIR